MLCFARVARHACRFVANEGFDCMSQDELAFSTPTVYGVARFQVVISLSFHMLEQNNRSCAAVIEKGMKTRGLMDA